MNPSQLIKKWIDKGKPYDEGIAIYEQFGSNATYKELFRKYKSSFYLQKLTAELMAIKNDLDVVADITPKEIQAKIQTIEKPTDQLLELNKQKATLFRSILKTRSEIKKHISIKTTGRISIADALSIMLEKDKNDRLKPFSVTYMSYNASRKTGGTLIRFPSCFLRVENNSGTKTMKGKKYYKGNQPRHWINSTRNFLPAGAGQKDIKKLHIWLMFEFNGMEVVASEQG